MNLKQKVEYFPNEKLFFYEVVSKQRLCKLAMYPLSWTALFNTNKKKGRVSLTSF